MNLAKDSIRHQPINDSFKPESWAIIKEENIAKIRNWVDNKACRSSHVTHAISHVKSSLFRNWMVKLWPPDDESREAQISNVCLFYSSFVLQSVLLQIRLYFHSIFFDLTLFILLTVQQMCNGPSDRTRRLSGVESVLI